MIVGFLAVGVGLAGLIFHLQSGFFQQQTLRNLVYAAPSQPPCPMPDWDSWRSSIAPCRHEQSSGPGG